MRLADLFRNWMSDGTIASLGLALEVGVGVAYVAAARRRSRRGRRWPLGRAAAFLAGLAVIALALDSGIAAHDNVPTVHMLQHAMLMMLGPLLLALGAPITLAMRTMSDAGRRRLRAVLHDPSVRGLLTRPGVLIADYNATMAVLLVTPVYRLAEHHLAIHVAVHAYLVFCGLLFWTAMLAREPVPARLPESARMRAVAVGIPLNLALAASIALAPGAFIGAGQHEAVASAWILVVATGVTSLLGTALIARRRLARRTEVVADATGLAELRPLLAHE